MIGAFTDNAGNVIEPVAIGATARNFIVPTGATQLQLGVNSQYYTCQVVKITLPLGENRTYNYDSECNVVSITVTDGNSITYTYDPLNRLILITYDTQPVTTVSFTYDFR